MSEHEVGVISGEAKVVAPITIEGGTFIPKNVVAGESVNWNATVRNNSQVKSYQIRYNITFGAVEPEPKMLATFKPFINGEEYLEGSWLALEPQGQHDTLMVITILPDCPLGKIMRFDCRVWTGEELIE